VLIRCCRFTECSGGRRVILYMQAAVMIHRMVGRRCYPALPCMRCCRDPQNAGEEGMLRPCKLAV
jgi:hypothetical protein